MSLVSKVESYFLLVFENIHYITSVLSRLSTLHSCKESCFKLFGVVVKSGLTAWIYWWTSSSYFGTVQFLMKVTRIQVAFLHVVLIYTHLFLYFCPVFVEQVVDQPVEGQPVDNEEVVEQCQGCKEKVFQAHLVEPASSYGLSVVHDELRIELVQRPKHISRRHTYQEH